jgi:hypothetical protein
MLHKYFSELVELYLMQPYAGKNIKVKVKVKLSLYLTKHHAMKTYWGSGCGYKRNMCRILTTK